MRLINARFGDENRFFWDERANSLEQQTTMPIQDHTEMGFSGTEGDDDINGLIEKLEAIEYYPALFSFAFGSTQITEARMQSALAQFVRSIQSFDSKYDAGRNQVNNDNQDFTNFTNEENAGMQLFMQDANLNNQGNRVGGGIGCANCHAAPEFAINPNRDNNGVIGVIGSNAQDLTITRSPTLRDVIRTNGQTNGSFFHDGSAVTLQAVLEHYNSGIQNNANLDNNLSQGNNPQRLLMSQQEIDNVLAFMQTLAGTDVYTNEKWSNPFIFGQ